MNLVYLIPSGAVAAIGLIALLLAFAWRVVVETNKQADIKVIANTGDAPSGLTSIGDEGKRKRGSGMSATELVRAFAKGLAFGSLAALAVFILQRVAP